MHRCLSFADLSRAQPPATTDVTSESDEANSATASNVRTCIIIIEAILHLTSISRSMACVVSAFHVMDV